MSSSITVILSGGEETSGSGDGCTSPSRSQWQISLHCGSSLLGASGSVRARMYLVGLVCSVKEADEDWAALLKSPLDLTSHGGDCRSEGDKVLPSFAAACFQLTSRPKRGVKSSTTVGMISAFFNL